MSTTKGYISFMAFLWIIVLLWAVLIFVFSMQTAEHSADLSSKVTRIIFKTVYYIMPIDTDIKEIDKMVEQLHKIVRKFAHVGLYFMMGMFSINAFIQTGIKRFKPYFYALILCFVYATSDEVHQIFVAGRSGQLSDILIDTLSGAVSIIMWYIYKNFKL